MFMNGDFANYCQSENGLDVRINKDGGGNAGRL